MPNVNHGEVIVGIPSASLNFRDTNGWVLIVFSTSDYQADDQAEREEGRAGLMVVMEVMMNKQCPVAREQKISMNTPNSCG